MTCESEPCCWCSGIRTCDCGCHYRVVIPGEEEVRMSQAGRMKRGERCYCQLTEQEGGPPNERYVFRAFDCRYCGRTVIPGE